MIDQRQTPPTQSAKGTAPLESARHAAGHWLETVSHLDPKYGGLSAVVPQLGSRLAKSGEVKISIAAFCAPGEHRPLDRHPELPLTDWPISRSAWLGQADLRHRFHDLVAQTDGLHIHGLWESSTAIAAHTARSLGKPYIISAHGMLEPWAIANKAFKKRVYAALFERRNLQGAACLHALTESEAEDYRRFGCKRPIAVIPNGVDLPRSIDATSFLNKYPQLRRKRIILFLGRIHFKKGLDILVDAWAGLAGGFPDTYLVLAGPDSEDSRAALDKRIAGYGIADRIVFTGMLDQQAKWSALASAHCFVLPSYSEGLSVATLEAMGMGLPVIISENCHLPEVSRIGAGWEVQTNTLSLMKALAKMLGNTAATNAEIGNRGRRMVHEQYNWNRVAQQMTDLYRWVQGGPRPQSFEIQEVKS